jgi:hypothetical protein
MENKPERQWSRSRNIDVGSYPSDPAGELSVFGLFPESDFGTIMSVEHDYEGMKGAFCQATKRILTVYVSIIISIGICATKML